MCKEMCGNPNCPKILIKEKKIEAFAGICPNGNFVIIGEFTGDDEHRPVRKSETMAEFEIEVEE